VSLDEQGALFAQVRMLEHDVRYPDARRSQRDRAVVDGHASGLSGRGREGTRSGGDEVVRAEEGELLEGEEGEHRPPLRAFDGEEAACGRRGTLEGNEPLDDRQHPFLLIWSEA